MSTTLSPNRAYLAPYLQYYTQIQRDSWTSNTLEALYEAGIFRKTVFDTSLKLVANLARSKFAKKEVGGKKNLLFLPAMLKKGSTVKCGTG